MWTRPREGRIFCCGRLRYGSDRLNVVGQAIEECWKAGLECLSQRHHTLLLETVVVGEDCHMLRPEWDEPCPRISGRTERKAGVGLSSGDGADGGLQTRQVALGTVDLIGGDRLLDSRRHEVGFERAAEAHVGRVVGERRRAVADLIDPVMVDSVGDRESPRSQ